MFSEKTLIFLAENRFMNSRTWFAEHRAEYERDVLAPLTELAEAVAPAVLSADGEIVTDARVNGALSRIYRDARYVRDGMIYRDQMWLSFKRDRKAFPCYPEFFFVIGQKEFLYGCGYYASGADATESARRMILADDPAFLAADEVYRGQTRFGMEGDRYKKSRYTEQPEEKREWLDRKNISLMRRCGDFSLLWSDGLAQTLSDDFRLLTPVYKFFLKAEQDARRAK